MRIQKINILRRAVKDIMYISRKKDNVFIWGSFDILNFNKIKEKSSLYAYLLFCYIKTAEQYKPFINSYITKKDNKIIFDEIDLAISVEKEFEKEKLPLIYIIRNAGDKSLDDINSELKKAKNAGVNELINKESMSFYSKPDWIRKIGWNNILRNPEKFKQYLGTTAMTTLHNSGTSDIFAIPASPYTCTLTVGSVTGDEFIKKINLSLTFDHNIIDGVPSVNIFETFKAFVNTLCDGG
ncbi:MAG TPA: hypothetical protein PLG90_08685 [Ignavibacteria bacterium]|nr:hypothetical protein [Ignavibacteria bacterium]